MVKFPWSTKTEATPSKPLDGNASFLLNLEGYKVIALRLPSKVAMELSGLESLESESMLSKLKSKLGFGSVPETEQWWTVTNVDNPLLDEEEKFEALIAQELTNATGTVVNKSDLAMSASVPINEDKHPPEVARNEENPAAPTAHSARALGN